MKSIPRTLLLGAVLLCTLSAPAFLPSPARVRTAAAEALAPSALSPSPLMEQKTLHAQEILRYLAKGDLKKVAAEAAALDKVTSNAGFDGKSDLYAAYGEEFLNQVRGLKKMADENNAAGAYYYFTRMTGVCFSCHEHVRNVQPGAESSNQ